MMLPDAAFFGFFNGAGLIESLPSIVAVRALPDTIRMDPRLPPDYILQNPEYSRRWIMDNILEGKKKLQRTVQTLDVSGLGNTIVASTSEQDLNKWAVPAGGFSLAKQILHIEAKGITTNNANNKTIRLKWGSQTIATIGPLTGAGANWDFEAFIQFLTATTQKIFITDKLSGVSTVVDGTQNTANEITIALTGQSSVASAGDVTLLLSRVSSYNANG